MGNRQIGWRGQSRGRARRAGLGLAAGLAALMIFAVAAGAANAANRVKNAAVYWSWLTDNGSTFTGSGLGWGNLDGSGGGNITTGGHTAGEAINPATGKIYWANYPNVYITGCTTGSAGNQIKYANLNGTGVQVLNTTGATVSGPDGVAVDAAHGRIYWANELGDKISYANLNGTGGHDLNTGSALVDCPAGVALDTATKTIYWANSGNNTISFASLNGSSWGDLTTTAGTVNLPFGVAIDQKHGRIYWANVGDSTIGYANLNGSGGGHLSTGSALVDSPYGVAVDPTVGRVYWANNNSTSTSNLISWASVNGTAAGNLSTPGAPASQSKYPVLLKAPVGAGAPAVTGKSEVGSTLACSRGHWGADIVPSLLYRAPQTFSYLWSRNGSPVAGARSATLKTGTPGSYACRVTARNYAGKAIQASKPFAVTS